MLKIGIDFDNTIACYDHVFFYLARQNGVPGILQNHNKSELKKIIHDFSGDLLWQKLQGLAYGQEMHLATVFPGFLLFLLRSLIAGNQVYIVSHKTEFGHFDKNRISLREASRTWIYDKLLNVFPGQFNFNLDHVFFETTRKEKINRINQLQCNVFIDDLPEVIRDQSLVVPNLKILYSSLNEGGQDGVIILDSWYKISEHLYGKLQPEEILNLANVVFYPRKFDSVSTHKQGGNSSVLRLKSNGVYYALKIYPNRNIDIRPRLENERTVYSALKKGNFSVPDLLDSSDELNWVLFEWLEGECPCPINFDYIKSAAKFIADVQNISIRSNFKSIGHGTEACLSFAQLFSQVYSRIDALLQINNEDLQRFIISSIRPLVNNLRVQAENILGDKFFELIEPDRQILSPGDFGAHNSFLTSSGKVYFFDFEYFGWDDPVKLVSDFYWHPGMSLDDREKREWLDTIFAELCLDEVSQFRLSLALPVFGIRWCLIMLRKFTELAKLDPDSSEFEDLRTYCDNQISKSKNMFYQIHEMVLNGYPVKIS